ncbi:MAG: DUF2809 domain-containing protein [Gemmatimonadales bacterium]|nr:DUF2809 domain-containing protein [Gemmatimonadales bacterium]
MPSVPAGRAAIRARSVPLYVTLACLTIGAGLASRLSPEFFPAFVARYAGDTLWAALIFWILALGWRRAGTRRLAGGAMAIAFAVECSQLYHAAWIESIRRTRIGALALGSDFLWRDFACYAVGVGIAATLDVLIAAHNRDPAARAHAA